MMMRSSASTFVAAHINLSQAYVNTLKRPSHVKLILANSFWQTQIGVCERHNNVLANCWRKIELVSILANFSSTVYQHVVMFTHTNLNLPKHVGKHSFDV